jgi:phosphoglycerol transferase
MKSVSCTLLIASLLGVYSLTLWAVLHPKVSAAYRSYYIERTTSDFDPKRYPGTPEEGMLFSKHGLPDWVASVQGFTTRDTDGRWTDAEMPDPPGITFATSFNGSLCLVLRVHSVPPLNGKEMRIYLGDQSAAVRLVSGEFTEYRVPFTQVRNAKRLSLVLPGTIPRIGDLVPRSIDSRRLGIDVAELQIIPGTCDIASRE